MQKRSWPLLWIYVLFLLLFLAACATARQQSPGLTSVIKDEGARSFKKIKKILQSITPSVDEFRQSGPIPIFVETHFALPLSGGQTITYDLVAPKYPYARGPMVVIVHGNRSYKEAHRYQGEHLASYGFQVFIPQLPTSEVWPTNGIVIKEFLEVIAKNARYKPILVGHSFGGSAITMAAYLGTNVSGLVYLDPAIFNHSVAKLLWNTRVPAILIGADPKIYRSKKRHLFREKYGGSFFEFSVKGATHNDAQFPSMFALSHYGLDPAVSIRHQKLISYLLTASIFSLVADRDHQYIDILVKKLKDEGIVFDLFKRGPLALQAEKE